MYVVVDQRGIDVVVTLFGPDGKKLAEVDSPNGTQGPEPIMLIVEAAGSYRLEVRSLEKDAPVGRYEAKLEELRAATEQDRNHIAAERAYTEGDRLFAQGTTESLRMAIKWYEDALPLFQSLGDRKKEADSFHSIGTAWRALGEKQRALDYLRQALSIFKEIGERRKEAITLNNIGLTYSDRGESQTALDYYKQALPLRRIVGDRRGEAKTLGNIGIVYRNLGENQKALDYYKQALVLDQSGNDKNEEAGTLNGIRLAYSALGEYQSALDHLNQALPLARAVGNRVREAMTLHNISSIYVKRARTCSSALKAS